MSSCTIEEARPEAVEACFALLPDLVGPDTSLFVARDPDGTLAGAGGMIWRSWMRPSGMAAWVRVLPDRQRRGIGRALLTRMSQAAASESASLFSFHALEEGGGAAHFATACGAFSDGRHFFYEADARAFQAQIMPLVARISQRIPAEAQVVSLAKAHLEEVKWLVAAEMATPPPQVERLLDIGASPSPENALLDYERSCVLMVGGDVAGALLSRRSSDRNASSIICNVIAPRWRGRWANALLLERFTRTMIDHGCYRVAFDCSEDIRDTIGLARRSGADRIAVRTRYRYAAAMPEASARRR